MPLYLTSEYGVFFLILAVVIITLSAKFVVMLEDNPDHKALALLNTIELKKINVWATLCPDVKNYISKAAKMSHALTNGDFKVIERIYANYELKT